MHFRPAADWKGIGYGFDWMRITDFEHITFANSRGDRQKYQATVSNHYRSGTRELETNGNAWRGDFEPNPTMFRQLEEKYKFNHILNKVITNEETGARTFGKYYCPWLSIYPEKTITVSLIIEVLTDEPPQSFRFEENEFFNMGEITASLNKGMNYLTDALTIECVKEFDSDQEIVIFAVDKNGEERIAGRLLVWANNQRKKAKVVSVIVQTIPEIPTETPMQSDVNLHKENTAHYLRQAYVEYDSDEVVELDLSGDEDFKNTYIQDVKNHGVPQRAIIGYYFARFVRDTCTESGRPFIRFETPPGCLGKIPENFRRLDDVLRHKLYLQEGDKYEDYIFVFYLDRAGGAISFAADGARRFHELGGYFSQCVRTVMLFAGTNAYTVAHELGHAFNLPHTFANRTAHGIRVSKMFTYKALTTDNVMDYSHLNSTFNIIPRNCFWYWQWIQMNKSIDNNGLIANR